jgi:hypothetical protein
MTVTEIKAAVEGGQRVYWSHRGYEVVKDSIGQWHIKYTNGQCIGLTHMDGVTLNGREDEFFTNVMPHDEVSTLNRLLAKASGVMEALSEDPALDEVPFEQRLRYRRDAAALFAALSLVQGLGFRLTEGKAIVR